MAPGGQMTSLATDDNGYLASVANPKGDTYRFISTIDGSLTSFVDPKGNAHSMTYDVYGKLLTDLNPFGSSTTLERSDVGNGYAVTSTSAMGKTATYAIERTPDQVVRTATSPAGLVTTSTMTKKDSTTNTAYPDGTAVTSVTAPDPRFGLQARYVTNKRIVNPSGLSSTMTHTRQTQFAAGTVNNGDITPLDALNIATLTDIYTVNSKTFTSVYTTVSNTLEVTSPAGRLTTSAYDDRGRQIYLHVPGIDHPKYTSYNSIGKVATVTIGDNRERISSFTYDGRDRLATATDPIGRKVWYAYDDANRVIAKTLPDGRVIGYSYDANGNLTSVTPPGRPAHTFDFNALDYVSVYLPPAVSGAGASTTYVYNLDKQLTKTQRPEGRAIDYTYAAVSGWLTKTTTPERTIDHGYDASGRLSTLITSDGQGLNYAYDGSLPLSESWTGAVAGAVSYVYDNDFKVVADSINGTSQITYTYDLDNLLTGAGSLALTRDAQSGFLTATSLGTVQTSQIYSGFGETESFSTNQGFSVSYGRDNAGRIVTRTETNPGGTGGMNSAPTTFSYAYDLAGRLTQVVKDGAPIESYTYDSNSNRLTASTLNPLNTSTATYDEQDRMLTYGGTTYSYNLNGDIQSKTNLSGSTNFVHDTRGNLTSVTLQDGTHIEYIIDPLGRRIGKKVNGTLVQGFLYEGKLRPIAELDGSGNIVSRFVYATKTNVPEYFMRGGVEYRIITDHLGSPRMVVNSATGEVVQRIEYDSFGNVLSDTNPGFIPFGFAGGLYDQQTKLTHFGARDYDAEAGRWTSKDPIMFKGGDSNQYGYAIGDPLNWVDADGLSALGDLAGVSGILAYTALAMGQPEVAAPFGALALAAGALDTLTGDSNHKGADLATKVLTKDVNSVVGGLIEEGVKYAGQLADDKAVTERNRIENRIEEIHSPEYNPLQDTTDPYLLELYGIKDKKNYCTVR